MKTCPYRTLGVAKKATAKTIKKAYYRLSSEHHPDKNGGDSEKFKEICEAYEVLMDENKRKVYDETGIVLGSRYDQEVREKILTIIFEQLKYVADNGVNIEMFNIVEAASTGLKAEMSALLKQRGITENRIRCLLYADKHLDTDDGQDNFVHEHIGPIVENERKRLESIEADLCKLEDCIATLKRFKYSGTNKFKSMVSSSATWSMVGKGWTSTMSTD